MTKSMFGHITEDQRRTIATEAAEHARAEWRKERERLQAENASLRAALAPFAEARRKSTGPDVAKAAVHLTPVDFSRALSTFDATGAPKETKRGG